MDFLGLRTLTVIQNSVQLLKKSQNINLDIIHIDYNDAQVLASLGTGKTDGVFQLESAGMKSFIKDLKPQSLDCRDFFVPARPYGFYPTIFKRKK